MTFNRGRKGRSARVPQESKTHKLEWSSIHKGHTVDSPRAQIVLGAVVVVGKAGRLRARRFEGSAVVSRLTRHRGQQSICSLKKSRID